MIPITKEKRLKFGGPLTNEYQVTLYYVIHYIIVS